MIFKPNLAADADLLKLQLPCLASPKLDGIRAIVRDGVVYSRSNKPIPNQHVQSLFSKFEHYDGELIVGEPTSKSVYRDTVSGVMSVDGTPDVRFFVFDHIEQPALPYVQRQMKLVEDFDGTVVVHDQVFITSLELLLAYESDVLEQGYEGLCLRGPQSAYKNGRSTVRDGGLLKLKRFSDAEAVVIGFQEREHNGNEAQTNELGRTKRSSHKAGKTGRGDLGALLVRTPSGVEFAIGTGFTDDERAEIWNNQAKYLGRLAKYKYFDGGSKTAPRFPVMLGWRDKNDL